MKKALAVLLLITIFSITGQTVEAQQEVNTPVYAENSEAIAEENLIEQRTMGCYEQHEVSAPLINNMSALEKELLFGDEMAFQPFSVDLEQADDALGGWFGITPSKGDINTFVVMVEFSDVKFAEDFTQEYVDSIMFSQQDTSSFHFPKESVNAWYQRSSNGKLSFHGDVETITLEHTREYYTYDAENNPDGEKKCTQEVLDAIENMQKDWSEYDSNGDYYVDAFCVIYAGTAEKWASQWWSQAFQGTLIILDEEYRVGNYMRCMESQLRYNAETIIHEMGHCLGLPDLYDTREVVDQMALGIHTSDMMFNDCGDFNALFKMMLGWMDASQIQIVEYGSDLSKITLESYPATGSCALLFVDEKAPSIFGEYYLVQYMDFASNMAAYEWKMKDEHLQIYHVNAELTEGGDFLYDNVEDGECRLIEAVDKDVIYVHGLNGCSNGDYVYSANIDAEGNVSADLEYACGYLPGDELTPYTAPSTGRYASDRLAESRDEFSGLNIKNIVINDNRATFDVSYEESPKLTEQIKLWAASGFKYNAHYGYQVQIISNRDIWLNETMQKVTIRERGATEPMTYATVNMKRVWPFVLSDFIGHNSFRVEIDLSADIAEDKDYEIVIPSGMFITSYGEVNEEIVCPVSYSDEQEHFIEGTIKSFETTEDTVSIRLQSPKGMTEATTEDNIYSFIVTKEGDYTLELTKRNHVKRIYSFTVGKEKVVLDVELRLVGDISGDGNINALDKKMLYNHIAGEQVLTDYIFAVGDINEDGKINALDKKMLYNHIAGESSLWN